MLIQNKVLTKRRTSDGLHYLLSQSSDLDPRETMKMDLPNCIQPWVTCVVGTPSIGEKPSHRTRIEDVAITFIVLSVGVVTSVFAITQSGLCLAFLPLGWLLTVHGSRKLRLTIMHACSHNWVFANNRKLNSWLGESISILTLTLNFKAYQRGHNKGHHSYKLLTPGDETFDYLINIVGFRLGMTVDEAWRHLKRTLLSPSFYISQFASRLAATFLSDSWSHNMLSFTFWLSIIAIVSFTDSWQAFFVAWLIPIVLFFEASSLLRQCVEHRFPVTTETKRTRKELNQMTAAIFCGEATPQLDSSISWIKRFKTWTRWWVRMLVYHLPSRVMILTGDSAGGHDIHHRHPGFSDWINCIFERQKEVEAGEEYYQTWGLLEAINETFKSLSTQTPIKEDFSNSKIYITTK